MPSLTPTPLCSLQRTQGWCLCASGASRMRLVGAAAREGGDKEGDAESDRSPRT